MLTSSLNSGVCSSIFQLQLWKCTSLTSRHKCTCMYVCKVNRLWWGTCTFTTGWSVYEPCICQWVLIWLWHSLHGGGYPSSPYVHGSHGNKEWKTYSSLKPIIHMHASACVLWPHAMWYQCKAIAIAFCIKLQGWLHYITWDIAIACPQLQHASD